MLADAIVCIHFAFIVFVLMGGLLVLHYPKVMWLHLPAAAWGAFVEFSGWVCPLTPLENWLRQSSNATPYEGDFVSNYLVPIMYPEGLTRELQFIFGTVVIVLNAVVYGVAWHRQRLQRLQR